MMAEQYVVDGIHHPASVSLTKTAETNDVPSFFRWLCKFGAVEESFRKLGKHSHERAHRLLDQPREVLSMELRRWRQDALTRWAERI